MRRAATRSVFIGGVVGLGLFVWYFAPAGGEPESVLEAGPVGSESSELFSREPPAKASSPPRGLFNATAAWTPPPASTSRPESVPANLEREITFAAPAPVSRLPLARDELAPDGLPVSGVRCSVDGGVLTCGDCRTDSDCPPNQGCVANRQTRRFECMASECEEDAHCFPGQLCRAVTNGASGAVIYRCVAEGARREGEPCDLTPVSPLGTCGEGLLCIDGVCGVPCRLGDATSCPFGHVCVDSLDGPGCFPDCRKLGCREGQQCQRMGESTYQCLTASHENCLETPCSEGEHCNLRQVRGRAVFWCARLCNPMQPESCPEGQVCGMGSETVSTCFRKCDPMVADSCGRDWQCTTVSEDMTQWGCRPAHPE